MDILDIQSKNISILRFPMIVMIVCIHARMAGNEISLYSNNIKSLLTTEYILGDIIATIAVPLYFLISGFLFFYQIKIFNKETYISKIKKRARTLLIPYFIWNLIAYLLYLIDHQFDVNTLFMSFFIVHPDGRTGSSPMDGPLWFIRNLYIVMLISPIIYAFIKRMRIWWLIPFLLLWILGFSIFTNGIMIAFIFFSLGAGLSICQHHLINKHVMLFSLLFCLTITLRYYFHYENFGFILSKVNILTGILFSLSLATYINQRCKIDSYSQFLGSISFFIYCLHDLILPYIKTFWINIYKNHTILFNGWIYISVIITDICLCILIYIILRNISPKLTNILIGGR